MACHALAVASSFGIKSTKAWGDPAVPNVTDLWLTPENVTDAAAKVSMSTWHIARSVGPHPGRQPENIIRRKMPAVFGPHGALSML